MGEKVEKLDLANEGLVVEQVGRRPADPTQCAGHHLCPCIAGNTIIKYIISIMYIM